MNEIATKQNSDTNIARLAAQRYLYSVTKNSFYIRALLATIIAVAGPVLGAAKPDLKPIIVVVAFVYFILDLFLESSESKQRSKAAKIQELFDHDVLGISWNDIVVGKKPDTEDVGAAAKKLKNVARQKLEDWYPVEASKLDLPVARIICQRANLWWDTKLRRIFANILCVILCVSVVVSLYINWNETLGNFIYNIAPVLPLLKILIQHMLSQYRTAKNTESIKTHADALIAEAESSADPVVLTTKSRMLQDEIYRHRKSAQPVPDFLYWMFRKMFEDQMGYGAGEKVKELLSR